MSKYYDENDLKILRILQADATRSLESIADEINVSVNTCWRRVQRLESENILTRRVALVDSDKVDLSLTIFVSIRTDDHSKFWAESFSEAVSSIPEIVEIYRLAGDIDYIMKIIVGNVKAYDRVYQQLISKIQLSDVSASFAMEKMKSTTELPI